MRIRFSISSALLALAATAVLAVGALAQVTPDPVDVGVVNSGHAKARLVVTAGPSGAPGGFEVCWMTLQRFTELGGAWPSSWAPDEGWVDFTGVGTLNTWGSTQVSFQLAPLQSLDVEIGDTVDETGVSGTTGWTLGDREEYVFVVRALGTGGAAAGALSATVSAITTEEGTDCTYTIGYWTTHPEAWPVGSLTLGSVTYSATELMSILQQPVAGNGLIMLAHQLIAAKLNVANGADPSDVTASIAAADALIDGLVVPPVGSGYLAPGQTSGLTQDFDDFNNGLTGPGHCGETPARTSTWGGIKLLAR